MNPEPTLAGPSAHTSPTDAPLLDAQWAARSSEELREIVQHGLRDASFADAARELERRSRASTHEAEAANQAEVVQQRTFVRFLIAGFVVLAALGLILGLFVI